MFKLSLLFPAKVENRNLTLGIEGHFESIVQDRDATVFFGFEKSTDNAPLKDFLNNQKSDISVTLRDGKTTGRIVACVPAQNLLGATQIEFVASSQPMEATIQLAKSSQVSLHFDELATVPPFYKKAPKGLVKVDDEVLKIAAICTAHIDIKNGKNAGKTVNVTHAFGIQNQKIALTEGESWALLLENYEVDEVVLRITALTENAENGVFAQTEIAIDRSEY